MNSIIYLGGGCFWCIESVFKKVKGVLSITPGYMGGDIPNPTYEEVCEGYTNHVEVVKVEYDNKINISQILSIFFVVHDPTSINRQGADVGTQYRSAIFCNSKERPLIVDFIQELESENIFDDKIVTEVNNIKDFYGAEEYHHDYFAKNPTNAYCQAVINPKIVKLKSNFSNLISE
ncbi:MAG: peptide-methionine (S)-S-oxide reductase MsrA [Cryomorphaceae bacterium]|jgi:peptide-methionine (S)-S-oxide reductase|nr:peptide-methionine (S)-S-oxide reductase MsrA [Cryomorphaceae bacterium]MBT3503611.1 peptide-methionine (S)-S-oxide reductase MsrA [Cryomorphaceae bacterium]MBT3689431.1 peptide-methionine (S)-S-oxide reductase MsrA [Cryomorphaceae bacterium]MBT4221929.1 peptide-methionine (S)-S-oxide reductase MsrA [Cryomorphaceae bacterium]MBT4293107.1 peptide-methionine (S)-S-oxide reductase MsrA [Cryomorphaceae bacterium]